MIPAQKLIRRLLKERSQFRRYSTDLVGRAEFLHGLFFGFAVAIRIVKEMAEEDKQAQRQSPKEVEPADGAD